MKPLSTLLDATRNAILFFVVCMGCSIPTNPQSPNISPQAEAIVFFNDMENPPVGVYTIRQFLTDWNGSPWELGIANGHVDIVEGPEAYRGKSLRVLYLKDKANYGKSGASWLIPLKKTYEEIYCAYRIKFAPDFDFAQGGKLPGLIGGAGNTSGHKPTGSDGWSARMIWTEKGNIAQHVYHPDQSDFYGDVFPWHSPFAPNTWHQVEHRIVMNTPGQNNGILQTWLDGILALDIHTLRYRDVDTLGIDTFYFTTFFGDDGPSLGPSKNETITFDNLMIATAPITH
jgi:hypothetical protein